MQFKAIGYAALLASVITGATAQPVADFALGSAMPVASLNRTIVIDTNTRWVNVLDDEVINFVVVGKGQFAWKFDGPGWRSFDLQQVAPSGLLSKPVTVYINRGLQW